MTGGPPPRWPGLALVAIALGGLALRLWPLLRSEGPLGHFIDYDEGVYFSASALLFQGLHPYRDFVFVHPPGLLYLLGLTSSFAGVGDPASAFAAARVVAAVAGASSVYLAGRIAMRASGPLGGLVAAALYATYPEVVAVERGPFLEPVLNLACLSMALVWLSPRREGSRAAWVAGALCGAAIAVKFLGGLWLLAALGAAPKGKLKSELPKFLAAAAVVVLVLVLPLALPSPAEFFEQALKFHALRPPDGQVGLAARLPQIFNGRHLVAAILALVGLAVAAVGRGRDHRFFAFAWVGTIAFFLGSSGYWPQYNAHLAASECVMAGLGAAALWRLVEDRVPPRAAGAAMGAIVLALAFPSLRRCVLSARRGAPQFLALGQAIRTSVPAGACVFAFEPAWALVGGRLPPQRPGAPLLVDPYAAMVLEAVGQGARYPDTAAAFQSPASQPPARAVLEACDFAVLGWRGRWQLSPETLSWFESEFAPREVPGAAGLELWVRRGRGCCWGR